MSCRCDGECMCNPYSQPRVLARSFADAIARMCALSPEDICEESKCIRHGGTRPCNCQANEPKEGEVW